MLLRNGVDPCRAEWQEHKPGLRELVVLNAIRLHARPTSRLAGLWIGSLERQAEPRAVA